MGAGGGLSAAVVAWCLCEWSLLSGNDDVSGVVRGGGGVGRRLGFLAGVAGCGCACWCALGVGCLEVVGWPLMCAGGLALAGGAWLVGWGSAQITVWGLAGVAGWVWVPAVCALGARVILLGSLAVPPGVMVGSWAPVVAGW